MPKVSVVIVTAVGYDLSMRPLSETNPYLRDPEERRRLLEENAYQSSVFEGAQGLPRPETPPSSRARRSKVSTKKSVKSE